MRSRSFGTTGTDVSVLGYGSWPLAGRMGAVDRAEALEALRRALDAGVNVVDTAQGYLDSELALAPVLREYDRDRVFLVSKVTGDYRPDAIKGAIESSLRRLGTDHLDLYFVHHWRDEFPIESTMETLASIRDRGLVRFLGVSNFDADQTRRAMAVTPIDAVQPRYSMLVREAERELLPLCRERGLGVLAHSSLAKGLLSGRYHRGARFAADDERSSMPAFRGDAYEQAMAVVDGLRVLAETKGATVSQLALAWVLRDPVVSCALVGPKRPAQMAEALAAIEVDFAPEEVAAIERLTGGRDSLARAFDV